MRTVKFYTFGCKVNQYDTQLMREQLQRAGLKELDNHSPADVYVVNTCTVTHRADCESLQAIRRCRRENHKARIIVTGCLTELDESLIMQADKKIIIVKNKDKENLIHSLKPVSLCSCVPVRHGISYFKNHTRAFLKIQDGCDNFCSYCKVPLVRGRSRSRPLSEIAEEAQRLADNGYKEIVLTGICLGAYGRELRLKKNLVDVIRELEKIKGLLRIRLSSIEITDISDELIKKMASSKKLCRHLHIPLQSGDDEILKKMNRTYTREFFIRRIRKIKKSIPEVAITTDVMVGFPGEGNRHFQNTLSVIREILPLKAHIFPFSPRPGTAVFGMSNRPKDAALKDRLITLSRLTDEQSFRFREEFLGRSLEVLFEREERRCPNVWHGLTDNYLGVSLESRKNLRNKMVRIKLSKELLRLRPIFSAKQRKSEHSGVYSRKFL